MNKFLKFSWLKLEWSIWLNRVSCIYLYICPEKPGAGGERREGGRDGEQKDKKRKESILDLSKYLDKAIRVKFSGGREASGILKGFDQLLNLVLDNTIEYLRGKLNV